MVCLQVLFYSLWLMWVWLVTLFTCDFLLALSYCFKRDSMLMFPCQLALCQPFPVWRLICVEAGWVICFDGVWGRVPVGKEIFIDFAGRWSATSVRMWVFCRWFSCNLLRRIICLVSVWTYVQAGKA